MMQAPDLKNDYEKALLIAIAVVSLGSSFFLQSVSSEAREKASSLAPPPNSADNLIADSAVTTLEADIKALQAGTLWRETEASPFVSRLYHLREGRLVDLRAPGNNLYEGIPNQWLVDYDFEDELVDDLPRLDADNDGFTNREEFEAKTDPHNPSSIPAEWTKLRLAGVEVEKLQIIFKGRKPDNTASINSVAATAENLQGDPIGPTQNYGINQTLKVVKFRPGYTAPQAEDLPFKLTGFRTEKRPNRAISNADGSPRIEDIEFAILESTTGDGTTTELEVNKPQTSPYSRATIKDTRSGQEQSIRVGHAFTVGQSGEYKLIDVSGEKATIRNLSTGEEHLVPKAETSDATPPEANQTP